MTERQSISIRQAFAGKGVLLTGSTGFLAKAVVEKILRDLPEIGQIYLLIRARVKADGSRVDARERLREEILRNSAFGRLREKLGDGFESYCQSKITCVPGDLTAERLGLDEATFAELTEKVHFVVNSAATVVFDERLDLALDLNTLGPQRLLDLARAAGAAYVHISTAYVSGRRTGLVPEKLLPPLEAIDAQLSPDVPRPEKFDVKEEVARLQQLARSVKDDCLKLLEKNGIAPESEDGGKQVRAALVGAGMRRAQSLGWNDTYTYTKFLGEQLVALTHAEVPTVVVRPSIIESSLSEPEPGWLDGLRMADPIIIGFGKGRLADFPADRDVVLDIIPADLVVNAILAAGAYIAGKRGGFDLFAVASSSENPLVFRSLYDHVRDYFQKHPMTDRAGKPVPVPTWKFPTVDQYRRKFRNRVRAAKMMLGGPLRLPGTRRMRSRLRTLSTMMEQLLYYVDIYGPYVNLHCRFETAHLRELLAMLSPEERETFDFDPRKIRWKHYLQDVHIPGLKRNILRMESMPRAGAGEGKLLDEEGEAVKRRLARSERQTVRGVPQTVIDLCVRGMERFGEKSLVEVRRALPAPSPYPLPAGERGNNIVRISYAEMFERSTRLARQLVARLNLHPGDRIALSGENGPEWALAYMAISRACCTAVPLDRTMPPAEAAALIKLVEAKAMVLSPALFAAFAPEIAGSALPVCLNMLADLVPFPGRDWPYPEASIGDRPLKEPAPEMLASILFTSGTTKDPKGVMLSHSNLVADALAVAEVLEPMESDRFLSVLPLHHAFEFTCGFLIPMYGGSTIHHIEVLRGKEVLDTMKLAGITVVLGVPRLFKLFMDGIKSRLDAGGTRAKIGVSLASSMAGALEMAGGTGARKRIFRKVHEAFGGRLRLFVSGGVALDPRLYRFFERFGITIAEGYGLTETAPVLTVNPLTAPKPGCVGPPVPGVEIRIQGADYSGIGEIQARGPTVMHGYWRNPAATEKAFDGGWFKTGDLGRIDKDGYLHITGRSKDVIVTAAGKNVYPDEVEAALRDIPGVKELCVTGLPARSGQGEEVAAIVVPIAAPAGAAAPDRDSIRAAIERASRELASHQRVARVEFQDEDLPKTSTLKVRRGLVRELYGRPVGVPPVLARTGGTPAVHDDGDARAISDADDGGVFVEVARAVAEVSERVSAADVTADLKLQMDLSIDSIGRVELLGKLEQRLNLVIPHEMEGKLFTVRDVLAAVEAARASGGKKTGTRRILESALSNSADEIQSGLRRSISKRLLQGMFSTTASVFLNTWLRIDCSGLENVPADGAYILAANHCSHLDSLAIRQVLGKRAAGLYVMGARDYFFDTRLKSWFFTTFLNALPFDREDNPAAGLNACKAVLERQRAILLFPEGTRSVTGELQAFKPGIGVLALELDAPVIPVHLRGTYESLPKGRSLPRPSRVEVRIGAPLDFSALKQQRADAQREPQKNDRNMELYRRAAADLRARVEALANLPAAVGR